MAQWPVLAAFRRADPRQSTLELPRDKAVCPYSNHPNLCHQPYLPGLPRRTCCLSDVESPTLRVAPEPAQ